VDYPADRRHGELRFPLSPSVYLRTTARAVIPGIRLVARHPGLIPLFCAATLDNVGDLIRRG
jgi:hypothetical protein